MNWISLIIAGCFEMLGVLMIGRYNQNKSLKNIIGLVAAFTASFLLLSYAMETIPMGTAYAIWTGIGAAGATLLGMFFFGEEKNWKRIVALILVIGSAIGLKLLG